MHDIDKIGVVSSIHPDRLGIATILHQRKPVQPTHCQTIFSREGPFTPLAIDGLRSRTRCSAMVAREPVNKRGASAQFQLASCYPWPSLSGQRHGRRVSSPKRGTPWLLPRNVLILRAFAWSNRMARLENTVAITASRPDRRLSFGATVSTLRVGDVLVTAGAASRAATTARRADPLAARRRGTRARFHEARGRRC
jgi:hypothetical protein